MSKTKLWISDKLELRHSETGWPEVISPFDDFLEYTVDGVTAYSYSKATELYEKVLVKAKAESILIVGETIPTDINRIIFNPNTFIETEQEIEVIDQWKHTGTGGIGWRDDTDHTCWQMSNAGYDTRKIARFKQTKTVTDIKFPDVNDKNVASIEHDQHLFNFLHDHGFISTEDERAELRRIANEGLKQSILEAFESGVDIDQIRKLRVVKTLSEVLDELNIK